MRTPTIPLVIAAANKARLARFHEAGVPLYLPAPDHAPLPADGYVEFDADDLRVDAEGVTCGEEDDDDFY